jgi:glycosyl transferase family 25
MKAKIITLKNNELSERVAKDCIEQAAKFGISVEIFNAINGLDYEQHLEKLNVRPLKKFKKGKPGVYGCFLSHYYLWKECAESNEPYLVLEHDGFLIKPLPDNILDQFEDVLKLESENPYSPEYENRLELIKDNDLTYNIVEPYRDMNNGAGWYSVGAYAYIIKPQAAKKLITWIDENGFLPADQQLGSYAVTLHECKPSLARLHHFYIKDGNIKAMSTTMKTELL